jgi:tetratricopeptide (TPR) repeat protein
MPSRRLLALTLFLAVVTAWAPSLGGAFVWDDEHDIVASDKLHHWRALGDVFRHPAMWSANNVSTVATYRPLALLTLVIDFKLYGLHPAGFHATSILLHALATLALFLALALLVADDGVAFVLALLFAIHPANAEAVAWINGRSEILSLGCGALALRAARRHHFPSLALYLLLSLLAKETGLVFVPLALGCAWIAPAPPPQESLRFSWPPIFSSLVALGLYLALRLSALGAAALPSRPARTLAALPSLWARATQTALLPLERAPVTLSTWLAHTTRLERGLHLACAVAVLALLAWLVARRRYTIALALAWWLGALVPAATVLALDYPWPGLARWLYIGLPGLILALYLGLLVPLRPSVRLGLAGLVGVAWLVAAERAIPVWRSDQRLYDTMCAESPDDAWAQRARGITLLNSGRYEEAIRVFQHVEAIDATSEVHAAYGLESLALTYLGRCDEARALYAAHLPTPSVTADNFAEHAAACYRDQGRTDEARALYVSCAATRAACAAALPALPMKNVLHTR